MKRTTTNQRPGASWLLRLVRLFGYPRPPEEIEETEEPVPPMPDEPEWVKDWAKFIEQHKPGTRLSYLGLTMQVVAAGPARAFYSGWDNHWWWNPGKLVCEYADKNGLIHEKQFYASEAYTAFSEPRSAAGSTWKQSKNCLRNEHP